MSRRLTKNIFSAAGQTVAQTVILFLLYRYLIDTIGIEQLGIWSIVLASASAARMGELGLGGSITKFVATYRAHRDDQAAAEALQTAAISVAVLFAIIATIAYPLLLLAFPYFLPVSALNEAKAILPFGLVSLCMTSVASIWMNGLDACQRSELRAGIMIFGSLIFFLFSLMGVVHFGLLGLAAAQVAQGVFITVIGWVILRRVMPMLPAIPFQWRVARFREMLGYGVNFQINSVVMLLFEPTTKILLGRYGGLSATGYFEMAQRLVSKVRALVVTSNRVIVPVYAGMISYKTAATNLYTRNMRYLLFLITPIFSGLFALTPAVSELWIGSFETQFIIMGLWITVAWLLNTLSSPAYFAYLGQGKLRWVTLGHVVMGITNILAGFFLGRIFGWQGVIAAFTISLVLGSIIPVFAYHYEHKISLPQMLSTHDIVHITVCFGSAVIVLGAYWVLSDTAVIDKYIRAVISITAIGGACIAAAWFHPLRINILSSLKSYISATGRKI